MCVQNESYYYKFIEQLYDKNVHTSLMCVIYPMIHLFNVKI